MTSNSSSSSANSISFRHLTDRESQLLRPFNSKFSKQRCSVTQTSKWQVLGENHDHHIYPATFPCIAEMGERRILICWSVLQLMRMYDLRLEGKRVTQEFPFPIFKGKDNDNLVEGSDKYLNRATYYCVCALDKKLSENFSIREKIKKASCNVKGRHRAFFQQYAGEDAVKVFQLFRKSMSTELNISSRQTSSSSSKNLLASAKRLNTTEPSRGKARLDMLVTAALTDLTSTVPSAQVKRSRPVDSSDSLGKLVKSTKRLKLAESSSSSKRPRPVDSSDSLSKLVKSTKRLKLAESSSSSKRPRPVNSLDFLGKLVKPRKRLRPDVESAVSKVTNVFQEKKFLQNLNLEITFCYQDQNFVLRILCSSVPWVFRLNIHSLLSHIPIDFIKNNVEPLNLTSESSDAPLIFTPLECNQGFLAEARKCAVTGTKRWNLDQGRNGKFQIAYPYMAKIGKSYIVTYQFILQLMQMFGLSFQGRTIQASLPSYPISLLINRVTKSNLRFDFNLQKGIQQKIKELGFERMTYKSFFENYRGKDVVELFRTIMAKPQVTPVQRQSSSLSHLNPKRSSQSSATSALPNKDRANQVHVRFRKDPEKECVNIIIVAPKVQSIIDWSYQEILKLVPEEVIQDHISKREEATA